MMSTQFINDTTFDDQRLRLLLEQKKRVEAEIQAQLAAWQPASAPSAPTSHHQPAYIQPYDQYALPRSFSQAGPSVRDETITLLCASLTSIRTEIIMDKFICPRACHNQQPLTELV